MLAMLLLTLLVVTLVLCMMMTTSLFVDKHALLVDVALDDFVHVIQCGNTRSTAPRTVAMQAAAARAEAWARSWLGVDPEQDGPRAATTLALGLLGLVVLGALAQRVWSRGGRAGLGARGLGLRGSADDSAQAAGGPPSASKRPRPVAQGEISCAVSDGGRAVEAASDFLRNLRAGAISVVTAKHGARTLGDAFGPMRELATRDDAKAVSKSLAAEVAGAMQQAVLEAWQESEPDTSELPKALGAQVVELLTVSPTMDALLDARIMPPSMSQPTYTLVVTSSEVRCITEGFVGTPLQGPADPNLKYTPQRMRLLSDNVLDVAVSTSTCALRLAYCILPTTARQSSQIARGTHKSLQELCALRSNLAASTWEEFLRS